jgi:cellobiose-specific phosphotransferase system component IIC
VNLDDRTQREERERYAQLTILVGSLGLVLTLIGLFPSITGVAVQSGIGLLQIMVILSGLTLLIIGALIFVKISFYPFITTNLAQDIAIRLSLTGLLMTAATGLADLLGYGTHSPNDESNLPQVGEWQAAGMVIGFVIASVGVLVFALMGPSENDEIP